MRIMHGFVVSSLKDSSVHDPSCRFLYHCLQVCYYYYNNCRPPGSNHKQKLLATYKTTSQMVMCLLRIAVYSAV